MNIISPSSKLAYWLDWQEFPDEYERMWSELAALESDRLCKCPESDERWQYMGTQWESNEWKHCFRHRHHPKTQQLEYRMITSEAIAMTEQPAGYGNLLEPIPQPAIHDLTDQMQNLLNANYPIPDPAWDYAAVWTSIMELQQTLTALTEHLQQQEIASPETDKFIAGELFRIREDTAIATLLHFPNRYQSLPC